MVAAALRLPASLRVASSTSPTKVDELIELMGLGAFRDKLDRRAVDRHPAHRRPRLLLAQDPTVLLLDEPSGGVAQKETEALGPLLLRVQRRTPAASMLVIEHDMPLLVGDLRPHGRPRARRP